MKLAICIFSRKGGSREDQIESVTTPFNKTVVIPISRIERRVLFVDSGSSHLAIVELPEV
jgi:hypothetical protein